jgi:hypothetical protein
MELARQGVDAEDAYVKAVMEYDRQEEAMAGSQVRDDIRGTSQAGIHPAANQRPQAAPARGAAPAYRESENPAEFDPLQRKVIARDARGRPLQTAKMPVGNEAAVMAAGLKRATQPKPSKSSKRDQ